MYVIKENRAKIICDEFKIDTYTDTLATIGKMDSSFYSSPQGSFSHYGCM
jgi:hypothetical protein